VADRLLADPAGRVAGGAGNRDFGGGVREARNSVTVTGFLNKGLPLRDVWKINPAVPFQSALAVLNDEAKLRGAFMSPGVLVYLARSTEMKPDEKITFSKISKENIETIKRLIGQINFNCRMRFSRDRCYDRLNSIYGTTFDTQSFAEVQMLY
jgi:hypothetical protein